MSANTLIFVVDFYVPEVMDQSVFETEHSLSNVLFVTSHTSDGIYEV